MDRRERKPNLTETILAALDGRQAEIWTALPGIVQSFDPAKMTCTVQPTIQARVRAKDSSPSSIPVPGAVISKLPWWWVTLPLLVDVPVVFQGGGGWSATFPIAKGDEAIVVFTSRCFDAWFQSGKVDIQADFRMHDLSDGMAIVGLRSLPRVLNPGVSTTAAVIRKDDNSVRAEFGAGGTDINLVATGTVNVTAPTVKLGNGGSLLALINHAFRALFDNHVHTSAVSGSPTSIPTTQSTNAMETSVLEAQ